MPATPDLGGEGPGHAGDPPPRPRILIVEDEFLIRLTLSEVLADEGFEVLEAETGDMAAAIMDRDADIAVLLTDVQLPGSLDGRALAKLARTKKPSLPIIFMTGRPDILGAGNADPREVFVSKPYLPSEICAAVRRLIAGTGA